MKLTLRKANALQLLITEQVNSVSLSTSASVSRYDDPVALAQYALNKFQDGLAKKYDLLKVLYSIRRNVAQESQKAGIPDILSEVAYIDKVSSVLKPLADLNQFVPSNEVLKSAHEDLKRELGSAAAASYGRRDAFTTGIIPEGWVKPVYIDSARIACLLLRDRLGLRISTLAYWTSLIVLPVANAWSVVKTPVRKMDTKLGGVDSRPCLSQSP